jgi:pimeloyl-ACP methyl ester carboxylesterase
MRLLPLLLLALSTAASAGTISLKAADGVTVQADAAGSGTTGLVLVPGDGRLRGDWADAVASLARRGHQVVALDLRKAGTDPVDEATRAAMVQEVKAAADWLRAHGATRVVLVGADSGASIALAAAAGDPNIQNVVMLSPRLSTPGIRLTDALTAYGARPLLLVTSTGDTTGVRAAGALGDRATGAHRVELVEGTATGAQLLRQTPALEGLLLSWVTTDGKLGEDGTGQAAPVGSTDTSAIHTTGTRLGEEVPK